MKRYGKWIAWLGVPAVLLLIVRPPYDSEEAEESHEREAADTSLCDPAAKPANLNFVLKDMNGKDFDLASQKGKVILLDFWATWCPPCKVEIPWFVEFQNTYGPQGFTVIGVSVDDSMAMLQPFAQQYKMNYPVLVGDGRDDVKGPEAYGPMWGLPKTFLIGRDGNICRTHIGFAQKETFEKQIKALM